MFLPFFFCLFPHTKKIVHVPPPDHEELAQPHHSAPIVQAQKHYKIIFIKAPSAPSYSAQQLVNLQPQTEEKTLVYVLVKKPESFTELQQSLPAPPVTPPSKPEVYFIKYKAQKEQQQFIQPAPIAPAPIPQVSAASIDTGSAIASLPIQPQKPAPVYGPAAH